MAVQNNEAYKELGSLKNFSVFLLNTDRTKSIDITLQMLSMTMYEDIFSPTLYGIISVTDSIGLMNGVKGSKNLYFPIVGEEFLVVNYEVAGKPDVTLGFQVYKIEGIENEPNFKNRKYQLHFVSVEHFKDATTLIQKSYKSTLSDVANDVFTSYLKTAKKLDIQSTKGQQNIIIPRLTPFESLDLIAKRSVPATGTIVSAYICFETTDGTFHFKNLEQVIVDGYDKYNANNDLYTYYIKNPSITDNQGDTFKTVISFKLKNKFDTIEKLKKGYFESSTIVYDFVNHIFTESRFRFKDTQKDTTALAIYPENSTAFIDKVTSPTVNTSGTNVSSAANTDVYVKKFFTAKDSTLPDTWFEQVYGSKAGYLTRLAQNMTTIEVYGDPQIMAGDVINLHYPEITGLTATQDEGDLFLSGKFLVATIQHKFTKNAYVATMDLYKSGYESEVKETEQKSNTNIKEVTGPTLQQQSAKAASIASDLSLVSNTILKNTNIKVIK